MGQFTLDLTRFVKKYKANINVVVQKVTLDAFNHVIMRTPVDTGVARGAWQVSWNQISTGNVEIFDNKSPVNQKGLGKSIAKDNASWEVLKTSIGGTVYLLNNMPYIRRLEYDSWSDQAPAGMVRVTITEFQNFAVKAAKDIR